MNCCWKSVVHLEPNSHLRKGFNNGALHFVQGLYVPVDGHIPSYFCEERRDLLVEITCLDDNFSIHLSLTSEVVPSAKGPNWRKNLNDILI